MDGRINNKGSLGNKGGSRKSLFDERKDAEWMEFVWKNEHDVEKLEKKVGSKRYSGRDVVALKLLQGNDRLMAKFMDKLVPDLSRFVDKDNNDVSMFSTMSDDQLYAIIKRGKSEAGG